MISMQIIRDLTIYAIEQKEKNSVGINPPEWLYDQFRHSVEDLHLKDDQICQWVQDIFQDLMERHVTFSSPYEPEMEKVLEEVNFQLKSSMVHLYTIVPVQGLKVSIPYDIEIKMGDDVIVRKIARWEWQQYFHMLDISSNNLPSFAFEWKQNVCVENLQKYFIDDTHLDKLIQDARLLSTMLQLQAPQGMAFPWMIQNVPRCQFTGKVGKISTVFFPGKPSDRPLQMYKKESILFGDNLRSLIFNCDVELRGKLNVALRRFHDAINKTNYQDRIVDQWIVVESLFGDGEGNKARKMACRLVCFLFENLNYQDRQKSFVWVWNQWYKKNRCKIVHGTFEEDLISDYRMVVLTEGVVRRVIIKMVESSLSYIDIIHKINKIAAQTNLPTELKLNSIGCNDQQLNIMDEILERYDLYRNIGS